MRRIDLEWFLVAAQDDPVLAAWTKVIHEYKVPSHCDVPPNEHWESYQEFFSYGLLTTRQFDSTDIKRVFFSGHRPKQGDVQGVLDNLMLLCPEHDPPEEPMSKAKPPMDAFSNSSAIVRRDSAPKALTQTPGRPGLQSRRSPGSLAAFQPQREVLAEPRQPAGLSAFDQPPQAGLACHDVDSRMYVGGLELNGHIVCCGESLKPEDDGGDIIPPEDMPHGEEFSMLEYMFHCTCPTCDSIYHCTVGKPVPRSTI